MLTPAGKIDLLREYATRYDLAEAVETGVYGGNASCMSLLDLCPTVFILDFDHLNCAQAMRRCPDATVVCGDSRWTMPTVCQQLTGPTLFWLDAHLIEVDGPLVQEYPCPVLDELEAISAYAPTGSVMLIDDLRQMGDNGWPTVQRLREIAESHWTTVEEDEDVMRISGWL